MRTGTPKWTTPHLDLPDGREWLAYNAITLMLENDPTFGPIVNRFIKFDGSIHDSFEPAFDWCPFCRVGPYPSESNWITESEHNSPLALRITLACQGTSVREILNLWAAMRTALLPPWGAPRFQHVLDMRNAVNILTPTITLSAYGMTQEDIDGPRMMVADGTIRFGLHIPTG